MIPISMNPNTLLISSKSTAHGFSLPIPFCLGNTRPAKIHAAAAASTEARRRSAKYQPNAWSFEIRGCSKIDHTAEICKYKIAKLDTEVKHMIAAKTPEISTTLGLIDDVEKLGLGYRYAAEIKIALDRFLYENGLDEIQNNLNAEALSFRLLRQHGFDVSVEVFAKFKDEDGSFKEWIKEDTKGMMSLYEASYLGFPGETLLDEANSFAKSHLKEIKENLSRDLKEQMDHVLELPYHRRARRVEAEWYIRAYGQRQDANKVLLELAVLDFNMVQSFLQKDLQDLARWWKSLGLANKLSFARDRLTESFFWAVGMVFEPQYRNCTKVLAKLAVLVTVIDDVYDVYGTIEELEQFTEAIHRWDINAINSLPDCMKLCFFALYNTVNEVVYEILKEKGQNVLPYLKKAWGEMCKSFLQEAKWLHRKYTPSYDEYVENGWISSSGTLSLVHAYFFLNDYNTEEKLKHIQNYHDLFRRPSLIFRFANDLGSASAEAERGETAKSISCCMKDNGISEERAKEKIMDAIDELWKEMNKERIDNTYFSTPFMDTTFNLARIAHYTYQYGDVHSNPNETSRKRILSVIVEPVLLNSHK